MNRFEDKFVETLNEDIFGNSMKGVGGVSPEGDAEAFANSMEEEGGEEAFNTLAPEGYAERHIENVKKWQSRITDFLDWLNGTDNSLRTELSELDDTYAGVSKDAEKKISDIAQNLGALKEILVEIPRTINHAERESQAEVPTEAPVQY